VTATEDSRAAREAALAVLRRHTSALEHRDIAALKAIWPVSAAASQAIETDFPERAIDQRDLRQPEGRAVERRRPSRASGNIRSRPEIARRFAARR
jgi:hypothetical protein